MHPNPAFHTATDRQNADFARDKGFGVLAVSGPDAATGPLISHIPFLLNAEASRIDLHLVRSNPISRLLDQPRPCRLAVSGPDGYISPDWYGIDDQVPTWNYVAVHLTGSLTRLPQGDLPDLLRRQSAFFEGSLAPKPPWTLDKMSAEAAERMMRMIMPCQIRVDGIDGTWKLSQNKPDAARIAAAAQVENASSDLARLMRGGHSQDDS